MAKKPLINLDIIAEIESSNNPKAYNKKSGAVGMYQITPICLMDYNRFFIKQEYKYLLQNQMYEPILSRNVADWYFHTRIPELLRYYKFDVTVYTTLLAYNWGVGNMIKFFRHSSGQIPEETVNYVRKYMSLIGGK